MPHICVGELGQHWFRKWLVVYSAPSYYLNQCWVNVNWTLRNKLKWNFNQNTNFFIHKNASENNVCEMAAILSRGSWVNDDFVPAGLRSSPTCRPCSKWSPRKACYRPSRSTVIGCCVTPTSSPHVLRSGSTLCSICLTQWPLWDVAVIFKHISNSLCRMIPWALGECHRTPWW